MFVQILGYSLISIGAIAILVHLPWFLTVILIGLFLLILNYAIFDHSDRPI